MCTIFFSYFAVKIDLIIENKTQCDVRRSGKFDHSFHPLGGEFDKVKSNFFQFPGNFRPTDPDGNN